MVLGTSSKPCGVLATRGPGLWHRYKIPWPPLLNACPESYVLNLPSDTVHLPAKCYPETTVCNSTGNRRGLPLRVPGLPLGSRESSEDGAQHDQ